MDKKNILGIVLIAVIMIVWMIWTNSTHKQVPTEADKKIDSLQRELTTASDVTNRVPSPDDQVSHDSTTEQQSQDDSLADKFGNSFKDFALGEERLITINTDNYQAVVTNKGGAFVR